METQVQKGNWIDSFKDQVKHLSSSSTLFHIFGALIAGFIAGFLIKQFGRYVLWGLLASIAVLWLLEMADVITIHYRFLQDLIGISPDWTISEIYKHVFQWIKDHILQIIACLLGFYLGRIVS